MADEQMGHFFHRGVDKISYFIFLDKNVHYSMEKKTGLIVYTLESIPSKLCVLKMPVVKNMMVIFKKERLKYTPNSKSWW